MPERSPRPRRRGRHAHRSETTQESATFSDDNSDVAPRASSSNSNSDGVSASRSTPHRTSNQPEDNRKPLVDDCYICYQPFNGPDDAVWCRRKCGQNLHKRCFDQWSRGKPRETVTCAFWYVLWSKLVSHYADMCPSRSKWTWDWLWVWANVVEARCLECLASWTSVYDIAIYAYISQQRNNRTFEHTISLTRFYS